MSILYIQHIIADFGWIGQRILLVREDYIDPFESPTFIYLSHIRAFCLFLGLSILPCLIIERFYATFHISDYESKRRGHIFFILLIILIIIGIITSYTYHKYESSLAIFAFLMTFCSMGILGNLFLLRLNKKYYNDSEKSELRVRYQIAENINVCRLVNGIVLSMGGFNGLICMTIILDNFNLSTYQASLSIFAFDISAMIYSTVFPYVCMYYCKKWKATFLRIVGTCIQKPRVIQPAPEPGVGKKELVLKNTFGKVMSNSSTEAYFHQLQQSWS
uniref:Serpentine receptor class gamma n=1 Tax=Caenorhabditis tropicalis TaxID=1561998 RepID=A0A1I7SZP4_9PELO